MAYIPIILSLSPMLTKYVYSFHLYTKLMVEDDRSKWDDEKQSHGYGYGSHTYIYIHRWYIQGEFCRGWWWIDEMVLVGKSSCSVFQRGSCQNFQGQLIGPPSAWIIFLTSLLI